MKLKNILSAALCFAGALLLGSCNMEEPIANPSISVDKVVFDLIPKEGGDVVVNLSSTVPWRTEVEGEGFTVSPSSGDANVNAVPVTIHADAWNGDEPRSAQISFLTNYSVSTGFTVKQEGALDLSHTYTPATTVSAGKAYLFVANDEGILKAAAPLEAGKSYGYLPYEVVTVQDNGSIKLADGSLGFILEDAGNGKFYLVDESGRYYYRTGTYKSFNVSTTPREDGIFTVVPNGAGGFKITCPAGYWMQFSSGYGTWGIYDSVNGIDPVIYEDSKEVVAGDKLMADANEKTVLATDTSVEFAITANVDWSASISEGADWVKTFTESGSGDGTFAVTFDEYTGTDADRTASFTLNGGDKTLQLTVIQQKVVTMVPATNAEFNALPADDKGTYQIGGIITDVTYSGNPGKYGNFHIEDHTGVAYIYGLLSEEGGKSGQSVPEALGLKNGDYIEVAAPHGTYNGSAQGVNAWPLVVYPYKTVAEFNALDDSNEARYTLKVEVTKITNTTYGNFEFKDATGTGVTYTCYDFDGTYKAFANLGLQEGDVIVFHALKTTYNGTIQAKNCQPVLIEKASTPEPQESANYTKVIEITEADAAAKGFVIAAKDGDVWHVAQALPENKSYGYLPYVDVAANADGSLTITDPACIWILSPAPNCWYIQDVYGRYLYMTGSYNSFNVSADLPSSGAEWTIENRSDGTVSILCDDTMKTVQFDTQYGSWGSYPDERALFPGVFSGAREISGGEPTPGPGPSNPGGSGTLSDPYNVDGAIAFIKAGGDKETSEVYVKGKVSSIKYAFDAQHGTATFDISADGTTTATQFTAYSVYYLGNRSWVEGDTQVAVGDEVVLYGKLTNYQGTYETSNKKAFVYSLNGKSEGGVEPTPGPGPDEPEPAGDTQSISWPEFFNSTENIDPIGTYTIDGIKFAFDKNGASTNPRYWASASAVRLYNKNTMTVTAPEGKVITQIEFTDIADNGSGAIPTVSTGAYTPNKWMGKASSVTLTFTGHMYHGGIKVTLSDGSASADPVSINEVWPAKDKVELYNPASSEADITGWTLTNGSETYTVPANKGKIAAGDHVSMPLAVDGTQGFVIVLKDASGAQISKVSNSGADMVPINEAWYSKESYGCVVDGVNQWVVFSHHSIGTSNENGEIEIRGLKGVKEAVPLTNQAVTFIDPVITYADSRYAVIQEGGNAALLNKTGHGYATGDLFEGFIDVTDVSASVTNQNLVLTSCSFSDNTKTRAAELPSVTMTIAQVKSGFADHLMHRVVLDDVTVTKTAQVGDNGAIAQGTDTIQVVTLVPVELLAEGAGIKQLVAFPYYASGKKQALLVFELSEADVVSLGASVDISATEMSIPAGASFTLTATTNSPERIQFYSTTPAVAEVTPSGEVTGVSPGEAEIVAYVKANGIYPYAEARCLVTVGEALPPAAAGTVSDIKAAYNGSSATDFSIALSGALVTYVSGSNFYLEDASGAILGYSSGHGLTAGDMVSGTISGKVTKYQGNFEITNLDKSMATVSGGNTVTPTDVPIATLAASFADYESMYVQVSNVTVASVSGKNITLAEDGTVIVYSNQSGTLPAVGTVINVRGLVTYYNATKEVKFYSIANDLDIVGAGLTPATITAANKSVDVGSTVSVGATTNSSSTLTYSSGNISIATVDALGVITGVAAGSTTITISDPGDANYGPASKSITVTVTNPTGGGAPSPETIDFSTLSLTNGTAYNSPFNGGNFTVTFPASGNNGKYYNTGTAIRSYGGNTFTISTTGHTISQIVLTFGSGDGSNTLSPNVGTLSGGTWTGSASSVTFTVGGTSGHRRIKAITVTYSN